MNTGARIADITLGLILLGLLVIGLLGTLPIPFKILAVSVSLIGVAVMIIGRRSKW